MSRFLAVVAALLLSVTATAITAAQEATPTAATFADTLGLPELALTFDGTAFAGHPAETAAGRYLVSLTNETEELAAADFVQLAEGRTAADLVEPSGPPPGGGDGTPMAEMEMEGSPAAGEAPENPLAWLYETYLAGGPGAGGGSTAQAIVDLQAGDYLIWNEDTESPVTAELTVTGEMPADLPEPEADVTVREVNTEEGFAFELEGELAPGPLVVAVENASDQPHFMDLILSPDPITEEQLQMVLTFDPSSGATPSPDMPNPEEWLEAGYAASQSADTTQWLALDLQPGYYVLACFIPDPTNEGTPHAFEGMVEIIPVGDL